MRTGGVAYPCGWPTALLHASSSRTVYAALAAPPDRVRSIAGEQSLWRSGRRLQPGSKCRRTPCTEQLRSAANGRAPEGAQYDRRTSTSPARVSHQHRPPCFCDGASGQNLAVRDYPSLCSGTERAQRASGGRLGWKGAVAHLHSGGWEDGRDDIGHARHGIRPGGPLRRRGLQEAAELRDLCTGTRPPGWTC